MTASPFDIAAATRTLLVGDTTSGTSGRPGVQLYVADPEGVAAARAAIDGVPAAVFTPADHVDTIAAAFDRSPVVGIDGDIDAFDDLYLDAHGGAEWTQVEPIAVRIQDYASSPYVSILGTTLVRLDSDDDVEAFLADADAAHDDGLFAPFTIHPAVEIADSGEIDGPATRLCVHPGGHLSVSPFVPTTAESTVPMLAAAIGDDEWSRRPWLPRYLRAIRAVRRIGANGHEGVRVSGFGARLDSRVAPTGADVSDAHRPILAFSRERAFVAQGGALVTCSLEAGTLLEPLLADDDVTETTDTGESLRRLLDALASQGISVGTRSEAVVA
ncbi:MAG: hypothetical protein NTW76_00505 [Corynebacteriales bacterium]|nr:hypothetical protein [Mycobacteriales bacterium]